jgi:hypothetical protein
VFKGIGINEFIICHLWGIVLQPPNDMFVPTLDGPIKNVTIEMLNLSTWKKSLVQHLIFEWKGLKFAIRL